MSNNKKNDPIVLTYERIEDDDAILNQGKNALRISKKILPADTQLGDKIVLTLTKESEYGKNCEKRGKDLLNEILAAN